MHTLEMVLLSGVKMDNSLKIQVTPQQLSWGAAVVWAHFFVTHCW